MSQKQAILNHLRTVNDWVLGYTIDKIELDGVWIGTAADTRLRELEREGLIEKRKLGKYVEYKALPVQKISIQNQSKPAGFDLEGLDQKIEDKILNVTFKG